MLVNWLVRVDQHPVLWLAPPHRHEQSTTFVTALHCSTGDPAGIEINNDSKVGEAIASPDVGYIRDPSYVRSRDVELVDGHPAIVCVARQVTHWFRV